MPRGAVVPQRRGVLAREALLPDRDRWSLLGVPALRPVRAVADLMRLLPRTEAVVVADAVQHATLVTAQEIADELALHARLRGVRQAWRALQLSSPLAESPPESRLRLGLVLAGLQPIAQYDVVDGFGRWLARVDLAFPWAKVAIAYDGRATHERSDVFVRDRQRQNELLRAGWMVLRYTADDLRLRPRGVIAEIRAALTARAA